MCKTLCFVDMTLAEMHIFRCRWQTTKRRTQDAQFCTAGVVGIVTIVSGRLVLSCSSDMMKGREGMNMNKPF